MIQPHMNLVVLKLTEECKTSTKTRFLNCVRHLQVNRHPEQLHPSHKDDFGLGKLNFKASPLTLLAVNHKLNFLIAAPSCAYLGGLLRRLSR